MIPSKLFYKLRADAIANGTLAEFEMTHCNRDSQGNIYPKSYLTTVVPVKENTYLKNSHLYTFRGRLEFSIC